MSLQDEILTIVQNNEGIKAGDIAKQLNAGKSDIWNFIKIGWPM